jgi:hypothetical protein
MWPINARWSFARGDELLQIHHVRTAEGLFVIERHDGFPDRSFYFADLLHLAQFHEELVARLLDTGWSLVDFWPERRAPTKAPALGERSGPERRHHFIRPRPS